MPGSNKGLRSKRPYRNDKYAIGTAVGDLSGASDYCKEGRFLRARLRVLQEFSLQAHQGRSRLVGFLGRQLNLKRCPAAIGSLDYGIRLKPGIITVIVQRVRPRLRERAGVNRQVAHAQVFEHKPKRLPVLHERICGHAE